VLFIVNKIEIKSIIIVVIVDVENLKFIVDF